MSEKTVVRLEAEWDVGPFWVSVGGSVSDNYLPDEVTEVVPLSGELVAAVAEWDGRYQAAFDRDVPQDSGMKDPADRERFDAEGLELARRIRRELPPEFAVRYTTLDGRTSGIG
ncbi:hypothetical protein [Saccharomonospora iraqiensis]|uniref:hypothetical protein n=1 Tax=Saccharomonospora iraqiensis TaxID=52698 RepID=UPI00047C22C7|nr:hypothetical protein [Saccharomonospora iraqiensis]